MKHSEHNIGLGGASAPPDVWHQCNSVAGRCPGLAQPSVHRGCSLPGSLCPCWRWRCLPVATRHPRGRAAAAHLHFIYFNARFSSLCHPPAEVGSPSARRRRLPARPPSPKLFFSSLCQPTSQGCSVSPGSRSAAQHLLPVLRHREQAQLMPRVGCFRPGHHCASPTAPALAPPHWQLCQGTRSPLSQRAALMRSLPAASPGYPARHSSYLVCGGQHRCAGAGRATDNKLCAQPRMAFTQ